MIRQLQEAGVEVAVNVAPVIPGLTDHEVPQVLEAVAEAGATSASWVLLRLPYQLKSLFLNWLQENVHPSRARRVESRLRAARNGKLYDADTRWDPQGPVARQIGSAFDVFCRRNGLSAERRPLDGQRFTRPRLPGSQLELFGG
jgi:DNA repair photolyase